MTARRTLAATVLVIAPLVTACGAGSGASPSDSSAPTPAAAAAAHHWWSGSDYCGLLRQTLHAGRSVLPDLAVDDPARLATTKAFLTAVEKAAPGQVAGSWRTLGAATQALVSAHGHAAQVHGIDAAAVTRAARAVATDAQRHCGLRLGAH